MTQIVLVQSDQTVVVPTSTAPEVIRVDQPSTIVVDQPTAVQVITTAGAQGPEGIQGPQGDQGPPGANGAGFDYTQSSPAATWTIPHNLGYRPSVFCFNTGGQEVKGDVQHLSANTLTVTYAIPVAGGARLN